MKKSIVLAITLLIVCALALMVVGCDKIEEMVGPLDTPTGITYDVDAGQISWREVVGAGSYNIRINKGETYPVSKTSFPYTAMSDEFTVTISAVPDSSVESKVKSASPEVSMTFIRLASVDSLSVDEAGVVSWTAVEGVTAYAVSVDGNTPTNVYAPSYNLMPVGSHTVKVKPVMEGNDAYYASWSPAKTVNVLEQVDKDKIVYEDGYIRWGAVTGASTYVVLVNGQMPEDRVDGTQIPYDSDNKNFTVSVQAIGDHAITFDGKASEVKDFVYLETVKSVDVADGILTWGAVSNASGYRLRLDGVELNDTFTECRYEGLIAEQSIRFEVKPVSDNASYFANWSVPKDILLLRAPLLQWNDSVELDGAAKNSIYWDAIANASGYAIKVVDPTGKETVEPFGESERSYANDYLMTGEYRVYIKATSAKTVNNVYDSIYSQPITVRRLAAPKQPEKDFVISDPTALSEGFTLNFTKVAGATAYHLYKDDTFVTSSTVNQFKVGDLRLQGETAEQTYTYKVKSIGSINRATTAIAVTLNSTTETSLAVRIKVLAMPTTPTIKGKTFSFGSVTGNSGYAISVGGEARHSSETTYSLDFLNVGAYRVSVCAKGNGADVLPSDYTAAINVERLAAPTDIKILATDSAEGQLSYTGVLHATSYSAVFDNNNEEIPVKDIDNIRGRISTKGTTLYMISVADDFNDARTVYYMTSRPSETKTFIKLATPTFGNPAFTNTQFQWIKPDNINEKVYPPTYEVVNDDDETQNGEINGTTMSISQLAAGTYTFRVRAIGNNTQYVDSDFSEAKTITKLETPSVTLAHNEEGYGVYQWKSVIDATKYHATIDGKSKGNYDHEAGATYQLVPDFKEIKNYVISVVAKGDNGFTTIDSDPWTIEQEVKQLEEPDFVIHYDKAAFADNGNIVVDITRETPYAVGYRYVVMGGSSASKTGENSTHYETCPSSVGTYQVAVYALGGGYDGDGVFYVDSQRHGGNSSYQITLLPEPNSDNVKISPDGKLSWSSITGASRYAITIFLGEEEYLSRTVVDQPGYVIEKYVDEVKGKTFTVTVQALGNGDTVISSKETSRTFN